MSQGQDLPQELLHLIREKCRNSISQYIADVAISIQVPSGKMERMHTPAMVIMAAEAVTTLVVVAHHEYLRDTNRNVTIDQVSESVLSTLREIIPKQAKKGSEQMARTQREHNAEKPTPTEGMEDPFDIVKKILDDLKNDNT